MTTTTHTVPRPRPPALEPRDSLLSADAVEILLRSGRNVRFEHEIAARRTSSRLAIVLAGLALLVSLLELALVLNG